MILDTSALAAIFFGELSRSPHTGDSRYWNLPDRRCQGENFSKTDVQAAVTA